MGDFDTDLNFQCELRVHVCDFGLFRAEHTEITLGQIEECKDFGNPVNFLF